MRAKGARLSHVVVELEGKVMRDRITWEKGKGLIRKLAEEEAGYLVYFPKGHVLRMDKQMLEHHGLDKKPSFVDMRGLHDPNSSLGQLLLDQDEDARAIAWDRLEQHVIDLATAKTGKQVMPEMIREESDNGTVRRKKKRPTVEHKMRKLALNKESA